MPRRKSPAEEDGAAPTFEASLTGLEAIVEAMEREQLPLEELVAYYERGSLLLDRCESLLQSARNRIELITLRNNNDHEPETNPEAGENPGSSLPPGPPDASNDDDIRLF